MLFGIAVAAAVVLLSSEPKIVTITDTPEVALIELPERGWQNACFAPEYHHLNETNFDVGASACWQGETVPERWTYLTFYSQDGSCERFRFQAHFLIRHGADYRCFSRDENEDMQVTISDGILRLR